jgi:hypothetical protein
MVEIRRLVRSPLYWLLLFAPVTLALERAAAAPIELLALYLILALAFFLLH